MESWQPIQVSELAGLPEFNHVRVVREITEQKTNSNKSFIRHQSGFADSNDILRPDPVILELGKEKAKDPNMSGYTHSCGAVPPRKALAKHYSLPDCKLTENDIILFQGDDMAVNHIMRAFCNPGDNFLVPSLCRNYWIETAPGYEFIAKTYEVQKDKNWEVNLKDLESKIDEKTRFIVVSNPAYPSGAVFSESHLKEIIEVAKRYKIPIVSDEVYADFVFPGNRFISLPSISGEVPVVQIAGAMKQYCLPGWNISWIVFYDRVGAFKKFIPAFQNVMQLMLHPAPYLQFTIPDMLERANKNKLPNLMVKIKENHDLICSTLESKLGKFFEVCKAQGGESLIAMLKLEAFKDITSEEDFAKKFFVEENVLVLPTTAFHLKGGICILTSHTESVTKDSLERLVSFCKAHEK